MVNHRPAEISDSAGAHLDATRNRCPCIKHLSADRAYDRAIAGHGRFPRFVIEVDHDYGDVDASFVVAHEAAPTYEPAERSFDHATPEQRLEAGLGIDTAQTSPWAVF
ncbi:hypothetical protein X743_30185 [Mesorhizobium sp. LNHC252B00]|nr:hypothetical protein X743_30185 [Mesorhizobium sp. LNHC252B00]